MVDTGATQLFISVSCSERLRVPVNIVTGLTLVLPDVKRLVTDTLVNLSMCFDDHILEHDFYQLDMTQDVILGLDFL